MEAGVLGDESATDGGLGMSEGQAQSLQPAPHPPTRFIALCTQDPPVHRAACQSISNGAFNTCLRYADSSAAKAPSARASWGGPWPIERFASTPASRRCRRPIGWALAHQGLNLHLCAPCWRAFDPRRTDARIHDGARVVPLVGQGPPYAGP
jgi:hypothetical protein